MSLERTAGAWAAAMGAVGAGIAAALLGVRYAGDAGVLVGFGFGVAVVGAVLSVGMVAVASAADTDGEPAYLYPATTGAASVLLLVAIDAHPVEGDLPVVSIALVGAAILLIVGPALVFVAEFRGV